MIGVIADDISGAAEIAGVGLRLGLRAEVLLKGRPSGEADLVCVDTDSRNCTASEAARRAAAAAKLLRRAGAKWIYKKVDSVLRGQVAAEIQAVRRKFKLKSILLHPANPSLGRTIKDGKYFIHGRLIHQTEFARDPAHPRRTADVAKLLSRTPTFPIQVCKPGAPRAETGVIICESTSARDVKSWVRKTHPEMLLAGGAEFFAALLAARLASANQRVVPETRARGSRAGRSRLTRPTAPAWNSSSAAPPASPRNSLCAPHGATARQFFRCRANGRGARTSPARR